MDDGHLWIKILIFVFLVLLDAVFFGFGSAIQNVNSKELEKMLEDGDKKAGKVLRIVNRPGRFINTIQLVSSYVSFITAGILSAGIIDMIIREIMKKGLTGILSLLLGYLIVYIISITLIVSLGIIIPKRLARADPIKWTYTMVGYIDVVMIILRPLIATANGLSYIILRLFGIDMSKPDESVTEEDIMSMVAEGHEQGVVESSEAEMITNIFQLNDKNAEDVMTHRKSIVALDGHETLKDALNYMLNEGSNSRYPVYGEDVDDIIGTLNLKDAVIYDAKGKNSDKELCNIHGLLREAHFIPETRSLDTLFKEMQSRKIHMVIVVDEYGQTSGIVTMEDILEEIVGNIMDEYDVDEELIVLQSDGSFMMNGMAPLDEVSKSLNIEFSEEEYDNFDTLNGYLISLLDRIPTDGEVFDVKSYGYIFHAIHVEKNLIQTVHVYVDPEATKIEVDTPSDIENHLDE